MTTRKPKTQRPLYFVIDLASEAPFRPYSGELGVWSGATPEEALKNALDEMQWCEGEAEKWAVIPVDAFPLYKVAALPSYEITQES